MAMTEEQKKVFEGHTLKMAMHMSCENHHIRNSRCDKLGLTQSVVTPVIPYDKKTDSRFGPAEITYFIDGDSKEYKTLAAVADAIIAKSKESVNA